MRKKQAWVAATVCLTLMILLALSCIAIWYIPLRRVDSLNNLEDYTLWLSMLYVLVCCLPPWFISVRKVIRLFKNEHFLTISTVIPKKVTVLTALMLSGLDVWLIREYCECYAWIPSSEVPGYAAARASTYLFPALMCAVILFYVICLLVKQIWIARKQRKLRNGENEVQEVK